MPCRHQFRRPGPCGDCFFPETQNVGAYANKKKEIWRGDQKVRIKADNRYYTLGMPRHWCSISLKKDGKTRYL